MKYTVSPWQMSIFPTGVMLAFGAGRMLIVFVVELTQPLAFVPVMVYVVVTLGEATTEVPVVLLNPVAGDQV